MNSTTIQTRRGDGDEPAWFMRADSHGEFVSMGPYATEADAIMAASVWAIRMIKTCTTCSGTPGHVPCPTCEMTDEGGAR
jgi:hypothetical protein